MHKDFQENVFLDDIHSEGTLIDDFGKSYVQLMYRLIGSLLVVSIQCASGSIEWYIIP